LSNGYFYYSTKTKYDSFESTIYMKFEYEDKSSRVFNMQGNYEIKNILNCTGILCIKHIFINTSLID